MNTVLTGSPGSYSYASGSIGDRRNTPPLAFNVQLGDYSSLEAGKNRDRNRLARRYRASARCRILHGRKAPNQLLRGVMRRGRNMPRRSSTILSRNAWQLTFRNAGGELRRKLPQLM